MEALSKIKLDELVPQFSDNMSLTRPSGISPQDGMACMLLMKQTKDRFINQQLPEVTQEMYLTEWEEMALRYGLEAFRDALSTAIRESKFFPPPEDIRGVCEARAYSRSMENSAQRFIGEMAAARAQWERERAEDREGKASAT